MDLHDDLCLYFHVNGTGEEGFRAGEDLYDRAEYRERIDDDAALSHGRQRHSVPRVEGNPTEDLDRDADRLVDVRRARCDPFGSSEGNTDGDHIAQHNIRGLPSSVRVFSCSAAASSVVLECGAASSGCFCHDLDRRQCPRGAISSCCRHDI
jgi:hypothetical protein